jgi:uncharacterized protein (DUF433 family)
LGCSLQAAPAIKSSPDYPYLEPEDIDEALQYAALLAEDETIELAR